MSHPEVTKLLNINNFLHRQIEITEKLLAAKERKKLSFDALGNALGKSSGFVAAAIFRQAPLEKEQALTLLDKLELPTEMWSDLTSPPFRGELSPGSPTDPSVNALARAFSIFGSPMSALIKEEFGDGTLSTSDFEFHINRKADPQGDRLEISFNGIFSPYAGLTPVPPDGDDMNLLNIGSLFAERIYLDRWQSTVVSTYLNGFADVQYPGNGAAFLDARINNARVFNYVCHRAFLANWSNFKNLDAVQIAFLRSMVVNMEMTFDIYKNASSFRSQYFGIDDSIVSEIKKLVTNNTAVQRFNTAISALPDFVTNNTSEVDSSWWSNFDSGFYLFANITTGLSGNAQDDNAVYTHSTSPQLDQIKAGDYVKNTLPLSLHLTPSAIVDSTIRKSGMILSNEAEIRTKGLDSLGSWARNVFVAIKVNTASNFAVKNMAPLSSIGLGEAALPVNSPMKVVSVQDFLVQDSKVCKVVLLEATSQGAGFKDMFTGKGIA